MVLDAAAIREKINVKFKAQVWSMATLVKPTSGASLNTTVVKGNITG